MTDQITLHQDALEAATHAVSLAEREMHTNESLGRQRHIARRAVSAYLAVYQVVTNLAQLDTLPAGSLILDNMGDLGKVRKNSVHFPDSGETHPKSLVAELFLPARVLHRPKVKP